MKKEHIFITDIHSNPNVGLYCFSTDKYCIVGSDVPDNLSVKIGDTLQVPVIRMTVGHSSLVGVFLAGNSKMLLVPEIIRPNELKILDDAKIKYTILKTRFNALGNNILCNDNGCIVSSEYSQEAKKTIQEALDIPIKSGNIAGFDIVGSCAAVNSKGCLVHKEITDDELKILKSVLKVNIETGTVNMGSPYIRSGLVANSKGFIIGVYSGGPEIANADEILGFLE